MTSTAGIDYSGERGKRRLLFDVKRSMDDFVSVHGKAEKSQEVSDKLHANDLRKILCQEAEQLRQHFPEPTQEAEVKAVLDEVARVIGERTDFHTPCEEEERTNSQEPLSSSTAETSDSDAHGDGPAGASGHVTAAQGSNVGHEPAAAKNAQISSDSSPEINQLASALDGAILAYQDALGGDGDASQVAERKSVMINSLTQVQRVVQDLTQHDRLVEMIKIAAVLIDGVSLSSSVPTDDARNTNAELEIQKQQSDAAIKDLEGQVQNSRQQVRELEDKVREMSDQRSGFESQLRDVEKKLFDSQQKAIDLEDEANVKHQRFVNECRLRMHGETKITELEGKVKQLQMQIETQSVRQSCTASAASATMANSLLRPSYMTSNSPSAPVGLSASAPVFSQGVSPTTFMSTPAFPAAHSQSVPVMTASNHAVPPQMSFSGQAPVSQPSYAVDAATQSLIAIQTQSHAYQMLVQKRPKHKYTGDNKHIDFESFLNQCEALMKIPGADDQMKLSELPFWFSGTAGLIIDRYVGENDATQALSEAFRALKREFGRKRLTAKQMLLETLQGEKFNERNFSQIKTFILGLEKIYKIAEETKREDSFNLPETINEIIRSKLPHLASKWAKKLSDADLFNDDDDIVCLTFTQFLTFAKKQNMIAEAMGEILKTQEPTKTYQAKPAVRVAATHAEAPARPETCIFCNGAPHNVADCRRFSAYTQEQKAAAVREKNLCTCCLGRTSHNHKPWNCATRTGCATCAGRHHTLLHGIPYQDLRQNRGPGREAPNL